MLILVSVLLLSGEGGSMKVAICIHEFLKNVKGKEQRVLDNLNRFSINRINLSVQNHLLKDHQSDVKAFIRLAHKQGMSVYAMTLERPEFYRFERWAEGMGRIKVIMDFSEKVERIDGIHVYTEVEKCQQFKKDVPNREKYWWQYIALLKAIREYTQGVPIGYEDKRMIRLKLSAAIPWDYHSEALLHGKSCPCPKRNATVISKYVDFLVPMSYRKNSVDIVNCTKQMVADVPTMVGIGASRYLELGRSLPDLIRAIEKVKAEYKDNPNFQGVCIHSYHHLLQLEAKSLAKVA
jgi:hypothetical protein